MRCRPCHLPRTLTSVAWLRAKDAFKCKWLLMAGTFLRNFLPPLYQRILPELGLDWPLQERRATCVNCEMVRQGEFHAGLKCCTYYPDLTNFMAGAILAQGGTAAQTLLRRLAQ